jgi:transcriptional regulator with XRE-family HTH domain
MTDHTPETTHSVCRPRPPGCSLLTCRRLFARLPPVNGERGFVRGGRPVAEQPALSFAGLLRQLRDDAGLTQEELAEAASLSPRSVSDLERGVNLTARHDTARLLAGALGLTGPQRALFEAAARGRAPAGQVLAAGEGAAAAAVTRALPRDIASFTGRAETLRQHGIAAAPPPPRGKSGQPSAPTAL